MCDITHFCALQFVAVCCTCVAVCCNCVDVLTPMTWLIRMCNMSQEVAQQVRQVAHATMCAQCREHSGVEVLICAT